MRDLASILDNNETLGQLIKTNFSCRKGKKNVIEITSSENLPMRSLSLPTIKVISTSCNTVVQLSTCNVRTKFIKLLISNCTVGSR